MKKNCLNCIHLDYYEAYFEETSESGYSCNKREYKNENDEYEHLTEMNCTGDYLSKSKKCCELK